MHTGAPGGFLSLGRLCGGVHISGAGVGLGSCCSSWVRQVGVARRRARGFDSCVSLRRWVSWTLWVVLGLCVTTWVYSCLSVSTDYINMSSELQKRRTSCKGWVTRVSNSMKDYLNTETVPDKVKLSEMLTDLDKRIVSLDMVQGEYELTFEDDTALLVEIDTAGTYRDTITDIRVQALQCLDKLTPDIPPTPPSDIGSSSVEGSYQNCLYLHFPVMCCSGRVFQINLRPLWTVLIYLTFQNFHIWDLCWKVRPSKPFRVCRLLLNIIGLPVSY